MSAGRIVIVAIMVCASLAACGGPSANIDESAKLKELTAEAVAGVDPASIVVSDVARDTVRVTWRATSEGKTYSCNADNAFRLPMCEPAV